MNDFFGSTDFDALFDQAANVANPQTGGYKADPNEFRPTTKKGTIEYSATLRFIPAHSGPMYVKKVIHYWTEGKTTIRETCLKTSDPRAICPICESNIADNRSGLAPQKARAKMRCQKDRYLVNVLVISDKVNPENNGKVMWWEAPFQIYKMIDGMKNPPTDSGLESINVFHPTKGYNFFLNMKRVGEFDKYEASIWNRSPTAIVTSKEDYDQMVGRTFDLRDYVKQKSAEEVQKSFDRVAVPGSTERVYSNIGSQISGESARPTPSIGGLPPRQQSFAPAVDPFDAQFEAESQGYAPPQNPAPRAQTPAPQPQAAQVYAPQAPVIPTTPAAPQPHQNAVPADDAWLFQ